MEKISPRVDIAFKKIFGVEENKDLLISLINSIVSQEDQVADVTLLNPYNPKNFRTDKLSILDIKAKGIDGKRFNIEVQISDEADYDKRALYYWAKLYTEQLQSGEDYSKLSKAIGIHILNFTSIPGATDYHNKFKIKNDKTGESYFKDLQLHTIELNKFISREEDELSDVIAKIKGALDIWLAFLTRNDLLNSKQLPKELNDPHLKKALNVLETMNFTPEERQDYEDHLKWLRMEAGALIKTEKEAEARGIEQGIQIGETRGRAEGEEKKATDVALNSLKANLPIETIASITGLSIEEIKKLSERLHQS